MIYVSATPANGKLKSLKGISFNKSSVPLGFSIQKSNCGRPQAKWMIVWKKSGKKQQQGGRILVTTLTKKLSEDLSKYLNEIGVKAKYLHSDIDTLERMQILKSLRLGEFDVLVGINLLREGLDLPEVSLVVILDADKEGFLRSETALIQTCGRAARNVRGRVILYADKQTTAIQNAIAITKERRAHQQAYNEEHKITPRQSKRGDIASLEETFGFAAKSPRSRKLKKDASRDSRSRIEDQRM